MTILANNFSATKPDLPQADLLPAEEAARRMKITPARVRQLCRSEWRPAGLACTVRQPGGGKPAWMVAKAAHPAMADIPLPSDIPVPLRDLTSAQRERFLDKAAILAEWQEVCRASQRGAMSQEEATALFLRRLQAERGIELTARTLRRWRKQARSLDGQGGLIDGRWRKPRKDSSSDDPFLAYVLALYLHENQRSLALCHKLALQKAQEQGWRCCSYGKARKFIKRELPAAARIFTREGPAAYSDKAEQFIERSYSSLPANGIWCADHHQLDLFVEVGAWTDSRTGEVRRKLVRPWITAWQDLRSRKIVAVIIYAGDPCTDSIILSFRKAVKAHGVPGAAMVDNGKDFDAFALHGRTKKQRRQKIDRTRLLGIFARLDVRASNVQPYHGQSKPIERFFGTLCGQFCKLYDSYCGNSPANRPEGLQRRLDAGRAPRLEELAADLEKWVEEVYNEAPHSGDGMHGQSPNAVFAATLDTKRTAPEAELDLMLLKPSRPVRVTRNGVRLEGLMYGKHDPALRRCLGGQVVVNFDPADLSRAIVLTLEGKFVCVVHPNERLPVQASAEQLRAAIRQKRHDRKLETAYREARPRLADSPADLMFREAAARRAAQQPQEPPPAPNVKPIRSPLEDQLPEIQRALALPVMRPAAGAEGLDLVALAESELDMPTRKPEATFSLLSALDGDTAE